MEEVIFVTHNKGKIASAKKQLKNVNFKIFEYELEEPRSDDIKYISKYKVEEAYKIVKKPCISLDCGFWINELNGFPRAFVNFSLETIGINGILKLMEGKKIGNVDLLNAYLIMMDKNYINLWESMMVIYQLKY